MDRESSASKEPDVNHDRDFSPIVRVKEIKETRSDRRKTVDCALLNNIVIAATINNGKNYGKNQIIRSNKDKSMKSQRFSDCSYETDSVTTRLLEGTPTLIESCNRFLSVKSRPIACRISAPPPSSNKVKEIFQHQTNVSSRIEFHEAFSHLIKLRGIDKASKNLITQEEQVWQTEVKDLIWLELQTFESNRSIEEEDVYLCNARQNIGNLLLEIMKYQFKREHKNIHCLGCFSIYCKDCTNLQTLAISQIESLLNRLEEAEKLYPSTKAMGNHYPLYRSDAFIDRVKSMCLWFNMTQHHRLQLMILNRLITSFGTENAETYFYLLTENYMITSNTNDCNISPYRRYIEEVLKSRGIGKSLMFLNKMHNAVLKKAQITLESSNEEVEEDDDVNILSNQMFNNIQFIEPDQLQELKRYGWIQSRELRELNLPSYIPQFLFLSVVPVELINEFLKMRLESRVLQPNILNLEQLIKELHEGLSLAIIYRERYKKHLTTVKKMHNNEDLQKFEYSLSEFNTTIQNTFELYLNFVVQLVTHTLPKALTKSVLNENWQFVKLVSPMIPGGHIFSAKKFCDILKTLLQNSTESLQIKINDLDNQVSSLTLTNPTHLKWQLLTICRETQQIFMDERENFLKIIAFSKSLCRDIERPEFHKEHNQKTHRIISCKEITEVINNLKSEARKFHFVLISTIQVVRNRCHTENLNELDEVDHSAILSRTREILHQSFKFGFDYHKELQRLHDIGPDGIGSNERREISKMVIDFAKHWIQFVQQVCEKGRGIRPRWAAHGFEFLILACDPIITCHLSDKEFEELKTEMDDCISHVIGKPEKKTRKPRSRKLSTLPRSGTPLNKVTNRVYLSQISVRSDGMSSINSCSIPSSPDSTVAQINIGNVSMEHNNKMFLKKHFIYNAIKNLEEIKDAQLREKKIIGSIKKNYTTKKVPMKATSLDFSWHRGIKIGQGRFGKVYTAVNNATGELIAMKEIQIQPGETETINRVAEELKIFEGLTHRHLVKYFGLEIHREELLIFMELCPEGTLESFVEVSGGLLEDLVAQYTVQLLLAVRELHQNMIVHRDIKPANIFLVNNRKHLKLGDFGSAVKIQAHTTMPGELNSFVGTQAYMAPEVFTKTNSEGHGRAADIWSVGCCVIEMASGKRPWYQLDSNFQIMFKVGMGEVPEIPDTLSEDGKKFIEFCLQHEPKNRKPASELLLHSFCKTDFQKF